ncbi:hypothetical protein BT69DRAFT_353856 [Atractiella rhizophila]|nr:hypothetical protein BT69DRAFT_353856 [Atractiella rhizophila]
MRDHPKFAARQKCSAYCFQLELHSSFSSVLMATKTARAQAALVTAVTDWSQEVMMEVGYDGSVEDNELLDFMQKAWIELKILLRDHLSIYLDSKKVATFVVKNHPCFQSNIIPRIPGAQRLQPDDLSQLNTTPNQLNILPYEILLEVFTACRFAEEERSMKTVRILCLCRNLYPIVSPIISVNGHYGNIVRFAKS